MSAPLVLHEDRLFPAEPSVRAVARELHGETREVAVDLAYNLPKRAYKL